MLRERVRVSTANVHLSGACEPLGQRRKIYERVAVPIRAKNPP